MPKRELPQPTWEEWEIREIRRMLAKDGYSESEIDEVIKEHYSNVRKKDRWDYKE